MKLELKHLAPYLPYGLKLFDPNPEVNGGFTELNEDNLGEYLFYPLSIPILRPLSDLTKEIMVNGEDFVPYEHYVFVETMLVNEYLEYLCEAKSDLSEDGLLPYSIVQLLFEWHFDVFGLIEKGLAIDINELKH